MYAKINVFEIIDEMVRNQRNPSQKERGIGSEGNRERQKEEEGEVEEINGVLN